MVNERRTQHCNAANTAVYYGVTYISRAIKALNPKRGVRITVTLCAQSFAQFSRKLWQI